MNGDSEKRPKLSVMLGCVKSTTRPEVQNPDNQGH